MRIEIKFKNREVKLTNVITAKVKIGMRVMKLRLDFILSVPAVPADLHHCVGHFGGLA